jgi:hypothetical protein
MSKKEVESFFDDVNDDLGKDIIDTQKLKTDDEPEVVVDPNTKPDPKPDPKPEDDVLNLERDKPKKKPTQEESNGILRKKLDQAESEIKTYKEKFGDIPPDAISPFIEYLSEVGEGVVDGDLTKRIIEEIRSKDIEIADLRKSVEEKEKKVAEIDVRYSDEFKTKYEEPYKQAANTLLLEFASVSPDKKLLAPIATKELHTFFAENSDKLDAVEVKAKLQEFRSKYKEETNGEDITLPSVTDMMKAIRSFDKAKKDMHEAYNNWGSKRKNEEQARKAQEERDRESSYKAGKRERMTLVTKAFRDYDIDKYDFIKEEELKEIATEEFNLGEKIFKGEDVPPYDVLVTRGINSRLWEKYRDHYLELLRKEQQNESRSGHSIPGDRAGKVKDWLED